MRTQPIVLTLALLVPFSAPAAPQTDEGPQPIPANHASRGPTPYVIVTTRDLRDEFVPLAREHTRLGTPAAIWTIESILPAYPAGRDDAERIRMFLQDAYRSHGARWVLIGGDDSQIPTRRVSLVKFCGDCPTLLPTDQYYACLEGSWNANGNDLWGEWPGDSVNTAPQLIIGRAPVASRREARGFVDRTIEALEQVHHGDFRVVFAANETFAGIDFAQFAERLRPMFESQSSAQLARLYQNSAAWPGSQPESRAALIAELEQGPDLALLFGTGGPGEFSTGPDLDPAERFTSSDAAKLENRHKTIYCFESAYTLAPDSILSIGRALMNNPHGGAVAVMGPVDLEFSNTANYFTSAVLSQNYRSGVSSLGEAMFRVLNSGIFQNGFLDLTFQGTMLFGDPALPVSPPSRVAPSPNAEAVAQDMSTTALVSGMRTALPEALPRTVSRSGLPSTARGSASLSMVALTGGPASTEARFELSFDPGLAGKRLEVVVFDTAGRRVRVVERGVAASVPRLVTWDLNDDAGTPARTGVYFVTVRVAEQSLARRVSVMR